MSPPPTARLLTPPAGRGALAVIALYAPDAVPPYSRAISPSAQGLDPHLAPLLDRPVAQGSVALRQIAGLDHGLVLRWSHARADLTPHGGPAVVRAILGRLEALGWAVNPTSGPALDPRLTYPEAQTNLQALMLDALARAASPIAIDLLLDQPRRWANSPPGPIQSDRLERARILNRLLDPPLVAAIGPPSVGKSTLLNALAGHDLALVHPAPGTTRDHVGALIDMAGLVVRYLDTPGLSPDAQAPDPQAPDPLDRQAVRLALAAVAGADLILLCGDALQPPPDPTALGWPHATGPDPSPDPSADLTRIPTLRVALRDDLGRAQWPADARLCAARGLGVDGLAALIRERLVPQAVLDYPGPWPFWATGGQPLGPSPPSLRDTPDQPG